MSEKKERNKRHTINLPVYDVQSQIKYITDLCTQFDFDVEKLTSFILADFIFTMENYQFSNRGDVSEAFIAFLQHVCVTGNNFKKLKEKKDGQDK